MLGLLACICSQSNWRCCCCAPSYCGLQSGWCLSAGCLLCGVLHQAWVAGCLALHPGLLRELLMSYCCQLQVLHQQLATATAGAAPVVLLLLCRCWLLHCLALSVPTVLPRTPFLSVPGYKLHVAVQAGDGWSCNFSPRLFMCSSPMLAHIHHNKAACAYASCKMHRMSHRALQPTAVKLIWR
jgi:hypothetical protein